VKEPPLYLSRSSPESGTSPAHLFPPLPATCWSIDSSPEGSGAGATSNPSQGATLTYHLKARPEAPVTLEIVDAGGSLVRTLSSELEPPYIPEDHPDFDPEDEREADLTAVAGFNRAAWDLQYDGAMRIPGSTNDGGDVDVGPLVPPGNYRLRLIVDGKAYEQPLSVRPDPRSEAAVADIEEQIAFLLEVRDRISAISAQAILARSMREQLEAHHERLADESGHEELLALGGKVLEKIEVVEQALYSPNARVNYDIMTGRDGGAKLYSRYGNLYLASLEHSGPPTQGMREVNVELSALFDRAGTELDGIISEDLAELNALATELGVDYVVTGRGIGLSQ